MALETTEKIREFFIETEKDYVEYFLEIARSAAVTGERLPEVDRLNVVNAIGIVTEARSKRKVKAR